MAYFARALWRGVHDEELHVEFMALVKLVKRKVRGNKPIGFVLYRHILPVDDSGKGRNEMIRIKAKNIQAEVMRFWPHEKEEETDCQSDRWAEKERGFPDCQSDRWEKTTSWLHTAVVNSWYYFTPDIWVKVGRPRQRKKKPMPAEDRANAILVQSARLREAEYLRDLKNERCRLQSRLEILKESMASRRSIFVQKENQREYAVIRTSIERLNQAIKCATWAQPKIDPKFLKPIRRIPGSVREVLT